MTATVNVRDATVHDVAELATLAASAYRETYRTMIDASVIEAVVAQSCSPEAFTQLVEAATSGAGVRTRSNGIFPRRSLPGLPLRG